MGKGINMVWIVVLLSILLVASVGYIVYAKLKAKKMLQSLYTMLESAEKGTFIENCYDESVLSAIEERMAKFLMNSTITKEKMQQEKGNVTTLISDIAHQTRTPVANILLYSQLLQEQPIPRAAQKQAEELVLQAQKLDFHLSALLKASRLENDLIEVKPQQQDIFPMLQQVVQNVQSKAQNKDIVVTLVPTQSKAVFDSKWTSEAIQNIVENAIKYSGSNSKVTLAVIQYDLFCKIDITDTGIGIAEQEQPKIFQRFYRSTAVHTKEGMGIGLYVAREVVQKQGGYIKVSSMLGKGSIFSVFLPKA